MAEKCAWVTLATNDAYSLGALVLAHSLRRVATQHELVIMITPTVTPVMKERLQSVFSEVITVDVLDSKDATHLALLSRPELGITFTKIHCWTLTQYKKCVFLDADTLVFKNCDELFEREELSAAPDVGWPDCFNSGVFVFQPSNDTFNKLVQFAQEKGSFDGGDQGLLNQFFSNWAREDIRKHLPFVYNVCSTAFYSYLPALKQYGSDMKIMHFIGNLKPWLQKFNWSSRTVADQGYLQAPLQYWWDIFLDKVHPCLDAAMAGIAGALSQLTIGTSEQGSAVDEHLRRQGWESGNIDYLGADAFDNIWAKISQTLSSPPPPPSPAPSPPVEAAPAPSPPVEAAPAPSPPVEAAPAPSPPAVPDVPKSIPEEKKDSPIVPAEKPIVPPAEIPKAPAAPAPVPVSAPEKKAAPSAPQVTEKPSQKAAKDSKATIEEKQDSKQAETEAEKVLAISSSSTPTPKNIEKLVCHLLPIGEVEPLVTPENEHEDAASIAQSIIAREEALSTPTITSATPPASATVCPTILQNIKDLSVDTTIPETPPVLGPVSLAQIGVISTKKSEKSDIEDVKVESPKIIDQKPALECPIMSKKDEIACKLEKTKSVEASPKVEESAKTPVQVETILTEAQACPVLKKQSSTDKSIAEKPKRSEKSKAEKKEPESPSEKKEVKTPELSDVKSTSLTSPLPEKVEPDKKDEPASPKEPIAPPIKVKKQRSKIQSTPSLEAKSPSFDTDSETQSKGASTPTELSCKLPSTESKTVKETEKTEAVKDAPSEPPAEKVKKPVKKPQPTPKAEDASVPEIQAKGASTPTEVSCKLPTTESKTVKETEKTEAVKDPPSEPPAEKVKKPVKKPQPTPKSEDISVPETQVKGASTPTELSCKLPSTECKTVKETEKTEVVKDAPSEPPAEKVKKLIKKPQPTPKADDTSVPESSVESASAKKSEDKPVPPPRKKEKKPKEKK